MAAENYIKEQFDLLRGIREALKNPKDITKAIASINEETNSLKKQVEKFEQAQIKTLRDVLLQKSQLIKGVHFIGELVEVGNADILKKLAFELKPLVNDHVILLAAIIDGKASVILLIDEAIAAQKNLDAALTIKQKIAPLIKGGGGGQKTLATAGGINTAELQQVVNVVRDSL